MKQLIVTIIIFLALFFGAFFIDSLIETTAWYYVPANITSVIIVVCAGWFVVISVFDIAAEK